MEMEIIRSMKSVAPEGNPQNTDGQSLSRYERLREDVLYLNSLQAKTTDQINFFFSEAKIRMKILTETFKKENPKNLYLPWVRFLDVVKKLSPFSEDFRRRMDDIIESLLFCQNDSKQELDERILRKLLAGKEMFKSLPSLVPEDQVISSIKRQLITALDEAIDHLDWAGDQTSLGRKTIQILQEIFNDGTKETEEKLKKSIIAGRFDKETFGLKNTIILGEDGGLYLLLNTVDPQQKTFIEGIVGQDYLKDKISEAGKIIIGQGGFGKVRFALNLIERRKKPNQLICVKKSYNFGLLKNNNPNTNPIKSVTKHTLVDYFTHDLVKLIYAPKVVDMAIISIDTNPKSRHKKGYIMMEIVPQNNGKNFFEPKATETQEEKLERQKWIHQKSYFLDVLKGMEKLLEKGVAMTDLKPENTLYDKDLRKTAIIDFGGTVRPKDLKNFSPKEYSFQSTKVFQAPELKREPPVDLYKALAFSCGKVLDKITADTDYPNRQEITKLIGQLTEIDVNKRMTIQEAIYEVTKMGEEENKETLIFQPFVNKIKEMIKQAKHLTTIGLNNDIKEIKELLIPIEVTNLDPFQYGYLERFPLESTLDKFFANDWKKVFLLLGAAGSGKSISLQLRFIDAIEKWKVGEPLPIYFNLANGIDLDQALEKLNHQFKTDLSIEKNLKGKKVHLYLDSFDEGFYSNQEMKEQLLPSYFKKLGNENTKILVSCRTDYSIESICSKIEQFESYYIALLNFENEAKLREEVEKYLKGNENLKNERPGEYTKRIKSLELVINTGFMFHLVMKTMLFLKGDLHLSRESLFRHYSESYLSQILNKFPDIQKKIIAEYMSQEQIQKLGQDLAIQLHIQKKFRINQDNELFKSNLNYKAHRDFHHQLASQILRLLPLKIESAISEYHDGQTEAITIGFLHDTLKNFYLGEAIFRNNLDFKVLSSHNIRNDVEFVRYLAEIVEFNEAYKERLLKAIFETCGNKETEFVTHAANAITILVAAKFPFSGMDLTGISIRGANLSNGLFHRTNFTKADLTDVILRNACLNEAIFRSTIMTDVQFGVLPDLKGHPGVVSSIAYSPDGKFQAAASENGAVKIWNASTDVLMNSFKLDGKVTSVIYSPNGKTLAIAFGNIVRLWDPLGEKEIRTFKGHIGQVEGFAYSPDNNTLATAGQDKTVKIWEIYAEKEPKTLQELFGPVLSVAYSPDGRILATTSQEIVKLWNSQTLQELATLKGHKEIIRSIVFSPDGKTLASGSNDFTVKIWDVSAYKELETLKGHSSYVARVIYSPDGKTLASSSPEIDFSVRIWDAHSGKELQILRDSKVPFHGLAYSPNGKILAVGGFGNIKRWEINSGISSQNLQGHTGAIKEVQYAADGKKLKTISFDNSMKIWDTFTGKELQTSPSFEISHSPDSQTKAIISDEKIVRILDSISYDLLQTLRSDEILTRVKYSPDGKSLITESENKIVRIWNVSLGTKPFEFRPESIAYSADGKTLAIAFDGRVIILDTFSFQERQTTPGFKKGTKIFYASDGNLFALSFFSAYLRILDGVSGKTLDIFMESEYDDKVEVQYSAGKILKRMHIIPSFRSWTQLSDEELQNLRKEKVCGIAFSPNGKTFVIKGESSLEILDASSCQVLKNFKISSEDTKSIRIILYISNDIILTISGVRKVRIWDLTSEKEILDQSIFEDKDDTLVWRSQKRNITWQEKLHSCSPDNKICAIANSNTITIQETSTMTILQTLRGFTESITSVAFSPDGKSLAVSSNDSIKIWEVFTDTELEKLQHPLSALNLNNESSDHRTFLLRKNITKSTVLDAHGAIIDQVVDFSERNFQVLRQFESLSPIKSMQQESRILESPKEDASEDENESENEYDLDDWKMD